jgi:hypothetical protein
MMPSSSDAKPATVTDPAEILGDGVKTGLSALYSIYNA